MEEKKKNFSWGKFISVVLPAIIILTIVGAFYYVRKVASAPLTIKAGTVIEIKEGETISGLSETLANSGIFPKSQSNIFKLVYKYQSKIVNIGFYELSDKMSMLDIIDKIDSRDYKLVKITIPEGWRVEQVAARLAENKIVDYDEFLKAAKTYEGKLFPDTYFFNPKMQPDDLVKIMTEDYAGRILGLNVTKEDLIIASIVEREAMNDTERPLIAGIYKNRIAKNMRLEADPTVQYGKDNNAIEGLSTKGKIDFKFWKTIKLSDYQTVVSTYNTYTNDGLPPGPICNPGLASITATINYQHHDYLYFLQNGGQIYPAKTFAEHNANRVRVFGVKL